MLYSRRFPTYFSISRKVQSAYRIFFIFILSVILVATVISVVSRESQRISHEKMQIRYLQNMNSSFSSNPLLPNLNLYKRILTLPDTSLSLLSPSLYPTTKILVLVVTKTADLNIRNEIRESWANTKNSFFMKRKRIDVVFLLGTNENYPKEAIQQENIKHQDILLVPVEDSYRNLVYKLLAGFRWISINAPHSHVVKIDSDAIVELDELVPLVLDRDEDHSWIVGAVQENVPPSRDPSQKWFVSPESFEGEVFPPYCNGPLYVISCVALKNLINSAKETKVIEVEDIFFTGILAERSGIKRFNDPRIGVARPAFDQCENAIAILAGYALQTMTRGPRQDYADFMIHKKYICADKFRELGFEN